MQTYSRNGLVLPTSEYEKMVIVPDWGEKDPCVFAFTEGKFAITIMMEHALFFILLIPPEVAVEAHEEAEAFHQKFMDLLAKIDASGVPKPSDLRAFCNTLIEAIKPFNEYKQRMLDLQSSGKMRSLVWASFFHHTSNEAVRWMKRLGQLATGVSEYDSMEVCVFWTEIVKEHDQYTAHLLDIDEQVLVDAAFEEASKFGTLHDECVKGIACDTCQILKCAEESLIFDTAAVRGIETAKIKSIIDPRLADHIRRETLKFVDELKRLPSI